MSAPDDLKPLTMSIVVPAYNASSTIEPCLQALVDTLVEGADICVVDDASDDETVRRTSRFGVHVLSLPTNGGVARARNEGARQTNGEVLCFVDADVVFLPDTMRNIVTEFRKDPSLAILGASGTPHSLAPGLGPWFNACKYYEFFHRWPEGVHRKKTTCMPTHCMAIRRSVFDEFDGFCSEYRGACTEDFEMGHRIQGRHDIWLYKSIRVQHFDKPMIDRCRCVFYRSAKYMEQWLENTRLEQNDYLVNVREASACSLSNAALLLFLASPMAPVCLIGSAATAAASLLLGLPLYRFTFTHGGVRFLLFSIAANFMLHWSAGAGALFGFFRKMLKATRKGGSSFPIRS